MSRYINVDTLKYYGSHLGDEYEDKFHDAQWVYRNQIMTAPSIDIVFCKECKWDKAQMIPKSVKCIYQHNSDDFCSYGERKDNE